MNAERKYNIIDKIVHLENEAILAALERLLAVNTDQKDLLFQMAKPIHPTLDLEALKKQKKYSGVNRVRFNELINEINAQEPIDELLHSLSK